MLISFIFPKHRVAIMAISVLRRAVKNTVLSNLSLAAMKTSTSMDTSDNKKTRHKLKKFLTRRPTLQAVRDKGYIKGNGEQQAALGNMNLSHIFNARCLQFFLVFQQAEPEDFTNQTLRNQ